MKEVKSRQEEYILINIIEAAAMLVVDKPRHHWVSKICKIYPIVNLKSLYKMSSGGNGQLVSKYWKQIILTAVEKGLNRNIISGLYSRGKKQLNR